MGHWSDISATALVEESNAAVYYRQDEDHSMLGGHMSDEAYGEMVANAVIVCADVVFYDKVSQGFYLAVRRSLPMRGLWWIGGRVRAGEDSVAAILRNAKRETKLDLDPARLIAAPWLLRYHWSQRRQLPEDRGSDNLCYMFSMAINPGEAVAIGSNLEPTEYDAGAGLRLYGRDELKRLLTTGELHPVIWRMYNAIFPVDGDKEQLFVS